MTDEELYQAGIKEALEYAYVSDEDVLEGFYKALMLYLLKEKDLNSAQVTQVMLDATTVDKIILKEAAWRSRESLVLFVDSYARWKLGEGEMPERIRYALKYLAMKNGKAI